jgi:hypothetical protein
MLRYSATWIEPRRLHLRRFRPGSVTPVIRVSPRDKRAGRKPISIVIDVK